MLKQYVMSFLLGSLYIGMEYQVILLLNAKVVIFIHNCLLFNQLF